MTDKKLVCFVGGEDQLIQLEAYKKWFELHGWAAEEHYYLVDAVGSDPDVIVVYAHGRNHVETYQRVQQPPPTIWFTFTGIDIVPPGTTKMSAPVRPSELFAQCEELTK